MNCPYCDANEIDCVPDVVYAHTERLDSRIIRFTCEKCKKVVQVHTVLRVTLLHEKKTDEPSDW